MQEKNWRSVFKPGTPKVIEMNKHFEKLLMRQVPEVYQKIKDSSVTFTAFDSQLKSLLSL